MRIVVGSLFALAFALSANLQGTSVQPPPKTAEAQTSVEWFGIPHSLMPTGPAVPHVNQASVHMTAGRFAQAEAAMAMALKVEPGNATCWFIMGAVRSHDRNPLRDLTAASAAMRRALELGLPANSFMSRTAQIVVAERDAAVATTVRSASVPNGRTAVAAPSTAVGAPDRGRQMSGNTPTEQSVGDPEKHYKIALLAVNDGEWDLALAELEQAAKLAPQNALIHYNIAVVQEKRNAPAPGMTSLRRAIALGIPENEKGKVADLELRLEYLKKKLEAAVIGLWGRVWSIPAWSCTINLHLYGDKTFSASGEMTAANGRAMGGMGFVGTYVLDAPTIIFMTTERLTNEAKFCMPPVPYTPGNSDAHQFRLEDGMLVIRDDRYSRIR